MTGILNGRMEAGSESQGGPPVWRASGQQKMDSEQTRAAMQGCCSSEADRSVQTELPKGARFCTLRVEKALVGAMI